MPWQSRAKTGESDAEKLKQQILQLVEDGYVDFNDVHLQEALERDHDIRIGRETLRSMLREAGRKPKRRRHSPKHRSRSFQ